MRRWLCWKSTTPTTTAPKSARKITNCSTPSVTASRPSLAARMIFDSMKRLIACGMRAMMPDMMMSEIPFPIPNSLIISPSHMRNMVPVVSTSADEIVKKNPRVPVA